MKREKIDILRAEIKIPEVVVDAAEDAFSKIAMEAAGNTKNKSKSKFKKKWFAIAMVAVLVLGTITVGATTDFQWFKPVEEDLSISEEEKTLIEKYAMGNTIGQTAVQNGITVTAEQYICDRNVVYAIFSVEGVDAPTGQEWLDFSDYDVNVGSSLGSVGGRYLGEDEETGKQMYAYVSENFSQKDITGRYVHVTLAGLEHLTPIPEEAYESGAWTEYDNTKATYDGTYAFKWQLNNSVPIQDYTVENLEIADSGITVQSVSISPLSVLVEAKCSPETYEIMRDSSDDEYEWWSGFSGLKMKDGSIVHSGGSYRVKGNVVTDLCANDKVIDLDQVEALLFVDPLDLDQRVPIEERDLIEVPLSELTLVQ